MDRECSLSITCHGIWGGGCFWKKYSPNSWLKITRSSWEASIHQVSGTKARPMTRALSGWAAATQEASMPAGAMVG